MKRLLVAAFVLALFPGFLAASPHDDQPRALRIAPNRTVNEGEYIVVFSLYATETGDTLLATESHRVKIDARGQYAATFDNVAAFGEKKEAWLAMRILPGVEGPRMRVSAASRAIRVQVIQPAAISGVGYVESTVDGFRFPSGATFSGFDTPVTIGTSNSDGVASTISRSDHVHAHGNQAGGSLHADATTGVSGFLSGADKTKLDSLPVYKRTIIVSPTPGNATASGTTLISALAGISGNSASDPYLLKIEPGIYDIGNATLTMKSYVDVEGSGQNATFINAAFGNTALVTSGAVTGAANAELRNLSITNTGNGSNEATGFATASNSTIRDVTITVSGGVTNNSAVGYNGSGAVTFTVLNVTGKATGGTSGAFGFRSAGSNATFLVRGSSFTATGSSGTNRGLFLPSSSLTLTLDSSTLLANGASGTCYGMNVTAGKATVYNSVIRAEGTGQSEGVITSATATAIVNVEHSYVKGTNLALDRGSGSTLRVATSMVDAYGFGTPTCIYTYDATMLANNCGPPPG